MSPRHFFLFFLVCLVWGVNFVVAKWSVTGQPVIVAGFEGSPSFFFAFMRHLGLYACLAPWLFPIPRPIGPVILTGLMMGAIQYSLMFLALQFATPSSLAITVQLTVPFMTILSVIFLKEKVRWVRITGMGMAFVGVGLVIAKPGELSLTFGLLIGVGAAFAAAAGSILVKKVQMGVIQMQAWIGLVSFPPLLLATLLFEHDQLARSVSGGWTFVAALGYTIVLVNIFGHGVYYLMLKRYDASLIAPLTLMGPLIGVLSGVFITGDAISWQMIVGGLLALGGVGIVAARRARTINPAEVMQRPRP